MIRAFIAMEFPEIPALAPVFAGLKGIKGAKPVSPHQMHLTLKFLGDISPEQVNDIASALNSISASFPPLNLSVVGLGAFPNTRRPRVLWAGIMPQEILVDLASRVDQSIVELGFAPEKRQFSPHMTLARFRFPPKGLYIKDMIEEYSDQHFADFIIKSIKLKKSTLTPAGPIYEDLHTSSLGDMEV